MTNFMYALEKLSHALYVCLCLLLCLMYTSILDREVNEGLFITAVCCGFDVCVISNTKF